MTARADRRATSRSTSDLDAADLDAPCARRAPGASPATPKELPPKWFYDERGSALFDAITRLPEYYPTRTERAILVRRGPTRSPRRSAPTRSSSSGSGTSEKTRLLLDALQRRRAAPALRALRRRRGHAAARRVGGGRASTRASTSTPWSATSSATSALLPGGGRRLVAFLGSTIGNLTPERAGAVPGRARGPALEPGDTFLLGTDLVKDVGRLEAAYDDAAGVTAEFNRNVLPGSTASSAPTSTPTGSSTWRCSTPSRSGSRCGCGRSVDQVVTVAGARSRRALRRRRGDADRDLRQVPPDAAERRAGRGRAAAARAVDRPRRRLRPVPVDPEVGGQWAVARPRSLPTGAGCAPGRSSNQTAGLAVHLDRSPPVGDVLDEEQAPPRRLVGCRPGAATGPASRPRSLCRRRRPPP